MRVSAISDVHVKFPNDEADHLLMAFLNHPLVVESNYIVLLGDIFDLMCGPHKQYLEDFDHIFRKMDDLVRSGKKVYFFEGNHDVHLERLFLRLWPKKEIQANQAAAVEEIDGKLYYFSHGDEHEVDNIDYQRYKALILSSPLRFVANHIMPYKILNYVGQRASKRSRKQGSKKFDEEKVRDRFRLGVESTIDGKYDFVLGGHSHVKDLYQYSGRPTIYVNNGYALHSKTFICIENHQVRFEPLA